MPELEPGTIFAGHRIEGVAGRGGMGVVYRATHLALDYIVALKVISPELASDERFRERFVRESRAAVSIRHPNVVQVRHAGEEDGLLFVTMDLIDGVDLGRLIRTEGALEPNRAVAIVSQVAAALDAAHDRGLLHRDVKPGNVLIEQRPGGEHAYLTDFGLTKRIASNTGVTATGAFVGTIDYVAPEQIKGGTLDARTDEYALGCVLFETVVGDPPFADRGEQVAKLYAHLQDAPPALSEAGPPGTPTALDGVVARALEKDPERRFNTAGALAEAATTVLSAPAATVEAAAPAMTAEAAPPVEDEEGEAPPSVEEEPSPPEDEAPMPSDEPPEDRRGPDLSTKAMPPPKKPSRGLVWVRRGVAAAVVLAIAGGIYALASKGGSEGSGDTTASSGGKNGGNPNPKSGQNVLGPPIEVKGMPIGIGVGQKGVYTSLREADQVAKIDPKTGKVLGYADVGDMPNGLAAKLGRVWVTNAGDGTVSPVNPNTLKTDAPVKVGSDPRAVGFAAGSLWVTNTGSNTVSRITPGQPVQTITVGGGPRGVAAGEGGVWISNGDDDSVSVINPADNSVSSPIQLPPGSDPKGSAISAGRVWVADEGTGMVSVINISSHALEAPVKVGEEPRDVAVGGGDLFVSNGGSGTVTRITPASNGTGGKAIKQTLHLPSGSSPENASTGYGQIWVADGGNNTVVPLTTISKK